MFMVHITKMEKENKRKLKDNNFISVIIPVYNRSEKLFNLLNSFVNQKEYTCPCQNSLPGPSRLTNN